MIAPRLAAGAMLGLFAARIGADLVSVLLLLCGVVCLDLARPV